MKKFGDIFLTALTFLLKIPYFWMPASWKGYRTLIITGLVAVFTAIDTVNLVDLSTRICAALESITHLWNPDFVCDITTTMGYIASYVALVLAKLRTETDSTVLKK